MNSNMPATESSYEQTEAKKRALAKKIASKTDTLAKVAKKYASKERKAECSLARDVFYEAMEEYEEGEYSWAEFITEVCKSLQAIKK